MQSVTAEEVQRSCPMVWVECFGKRVLARTACRDGKALLTITDMAILRQIDGDGTFIFEWKELADALNNARPIFINCQARKLET